MSSLPPRPGLTVAIPARDEVERIERCLESVLTQEGVDLEVIVVDDGSSDGTGFIVRERFPEVRVLGLALQTRATPSPSTRTRTRTLPMPGRGLQTRGKTTTSGMSTRHMIASCSMATTSSMPRPPSLTAATATSATAARAARPRSGSAPTPHR